MVVGLGKYKDKSEAYPLDKATLNKVALRSILTPFSENSETASSIGWSFAIDPALRKIHTNEEDLSLALGHNLEYVKARTCLAPLAMGAVLAMEQEKADLETIRSTRLAISSACEGFGLSYYALVIGTLLLNFIQKNNTVAIGIGVALLVLDVIIRLISIRIGYKHAAKIASGLSRKGDRGLNAFKTLGVIMIGALVVYGSLLMKNTINPQTLNIDINYINPFISLGVIYLLYTLLTKKNFSMGKCVLIILVLGALLGFISTVI